MNARKRKYSRRSGPERTLNFLFNEAEVADLLGISPATLRRWRRLGVGPSWCKLGASVRYRREDVASYLESNISSVSAPPSANQLRKGSE